MMNRYQMLLERTSDAVVLFDRQGIVRAVDADPDYTRRPEPEETLAVLRPPA